MYRLLLRTSVKKKFSKLAKRNPGQLLVIEKKLSEVRQNPQHYKHLRKPLQHLYRVHINRHFVLVYSVEDDKVIVEDYDHHDNIYT